MFTNSEVIGDSAVRDLAAHVQHARTIDDVLGQLLQGTLASNCLFQFDFICSSRFDEQSYVCKTGISSVCASGISFI